jgi:metalloendopeptidase OMA1, mitochondrial
MRKIARLLSSWGRGRLSDGRQSSWQSGQETNSVVHFQRRFGGSNPPGRKPYILAGAVVVLGGTYYVAHIDRAPVTRRRRMIDLSRKHEHEIGEYAFTHLLHQHRTRIVPSSHPDSRRVQRVGERIANAARREYPELVNDFKWRFVLFDMPGEANALCCAGGKVAVFSGLLHVTQDDDALAAVLAHEVAHAVARHSAERISFSKIIFAFQLLVNTVVDFSSLTALLSELLLNLPYSRKLELEADHIGLEIMAVACYDPSASPRMFRRLADLQAESSASTKQGMVVSLLSTHPVFSDRIVKINGWLPQAAKTYNANCNHSDLTAWITASTGRAA